MSDAYKIAVRISLIEGVTRGLQLMSRHFKTTDAEAKVLEARMKSIAKMAAVGTGLMAGGFSGLALLKAPLEEAKKYQILMERFQQFGMGDAAMKDAQKFVEAQDIMGASQRDMMRYFIEAQGVFRESGAKSVGEQLAAAKMAAPMMAKMNFAMTGLDEHTKQATEAKQMDMLRFVEQAGGLKSPKRFAELLDAGFRAVQSSGGNVDFTQYRQFMARAGSSAMNMSMRSMFADFEPLIGEMKGSTAGTALMTSFNRLNGIVKLPNQVSHELVNNGLWDGSKIEWNSQGGIKSFKGNPMINSKLFGSDPVEYYRQMVQPMYKKMGLDAAQIVVENSKIFGRTGGAMFNLIEKQLPTILRSRPALEKAKGIDATYVAIGQTYAGRELALTAKWQTLMLVIGKDGGILDMAATGLSMLTRPLGQIIKFAQGHKDLTRFAVSGFAILSVLAIAGGALTLFTASIRALLLIRNIVPLIRGIGIGFRILLAALPYIGQGLRVLLGAFGALGLAIGAIAVVGLLVWNNWKEIKAAFFTICKDIYSGFYKLFHGDILGALGSFGHAFLLTFQTIINTIIAGVNRINPLFQIPKTSFAGPADGSSPAVRPASGQPMQVHTAIHMDGKKVAQAVTTHQAKAAGRPNTGGSGFDATRARPAVAGGR